MSKKGFKSFVGMGAISLAVILIVLTITCFAVLTYVSADSEYKLSEKSRYAVNEYYRADARANEILEDLSTAIKSGNLQDFIAKKGYNVTGSKDQEVIAFQVPISDQKELRVEAAFSSYDKVEILKWETETIEQEGRE